jgi:hypothetical protein
MKARKAGRRRWAAAVLGSLAASFAPRPADAEVPIKDWEVNGIISRSASEILKSPSGSSMSTETVTAFLRERSQAKALLEYDSDNSCPIGGKVYNLSSQAFFNVTITLTESETRGGTGTEKTLHVAFLPAKSYARFSIACNRNSAFGRRSAYLSVSSFADVTPLSAAGVAQMLGQSADAMELGGTFSAGAASGSVGDQVLYDAEGALFRDVAAAFLGGEAGGAALGRLAANQGRSAKVDAIAALLPRATPAAAASMLAALLGAGAGGSPLFRPLADKVCGAAQPERAKASLWTEALSGRFGTGEGRAAILKRCGGNPQQTKERLKAAKDEEVVAALGVLEGPALAGAMEVLAGPPPRWKQIAAFLGEAGDAKRFGDVAARFPVASVDTATAVGEVARALARSASSDLDAFRAPLLQAAIDRAQALDPGEAAKLMGELAGLAARGRVPAPALQKVLKERASLAPGSVKEAIAEVVRDESKVLAPAWLLARADGGGLDLQAFLATNRANLKTCTGSATAVRGCLRRIKEKVPDVAREAFEPSFVEAAQATLESADEDTIVETAEVMGGVGLDTAPVALHLCERAGGIVANRKGNVDKASSYLSAALKVDAKASCVAAVRGDMRTRSLREAGDLALRILAMFAPVAFGAFYLRRSWKPVRAKLLAADQGKEKQPGKGERRLHPAAWSKALNTGLAHAAVALEGDSDDAHRAAAKVLLGLSAEARAEIVKKARAAANETVRTGEVGSVLLKTPEAAIYVVCFAGRAEQAQTVRAHEAFRDGWEPHAARVREALAVESPELPLLGLLFFLHADVTSGTMLVALEAEGLRMIPERLLNEREAKTHAGQINRHHQELALGDEPALPTAETTAAMEA